PPDDLELSPNGSGPYQFVDWERGSRLELERNEEYWGEIPSVRRATIRVVPEASGRVAELMSGRAQIATKIPPQLMPALESRQGIAIVTAPDTYTMQLDFNTHREVVQDPRVRQAISYAINRQDLLDHVLNGVGALQETPVPAFALGYDP